MSSLASRLYERLGARYLLVIGGVIVVTGIVATCIAALAAIGYLDLPSRVFVGIFLLGGTASVVATALSVVTGVKMMAPLFRWLAGDRNAESAPAAWMAGTGRLLPMILAGIVYYSVAMLPAVVYTAHHAGMPFYGSLMIWIGVEVTIVVAAIVDLFAVEGLFRPVLRDIARYLPDDFRIPASGVRLRWKLIFLSSVITMFTGVIVASAVGRAHSPQTRIAVGIGVAFAMASTVAMLLTALVARSVASPVERLEGASRAVEMGDLSIRVPVTTTDELGVLGYRFNAMIRGLKEREALHAAMGTYVDPGVAKRILEEGQLLEGTEVEVTILFLDIRDFTALVETMNARDAISFLNRFFQNVVPLIDAEGGHVNKFTGDGLLAVFGVPEALPDHADRAVAAARRITETVSAVYPTLGIGIGLNSGPVAAGTVGGGAHLEYTLIGDTVNVAARVEELTKGTPDQILMTEATQRLCSTDGLEPRGSIRLRGVGRDVGIFAALSVPTGTHAAVEPKSRRL